MNLTQTVTKLVKELTDENALFTVYDITRLIQFKNPGVAVDHNKVRSIVENLFYNGGFTSAYSRHVGYHLPFEPPPQVYYNSAVSLHSDYKPDTLDPAKLAPKTTRPQGLVVNNEVVANKKPIRVFAVKLRGKNVWRRPYSRGKGSTTNFAEASLYASKNGPNQLLRSSKDAAKWEVVQYELTYNPVVTS